MPTFEEKSNPYEILIRFDEVTGALKGAHQRRINVVLRDGAVLQAQEGDAVPLDLADFAASDLMSETLAAALAANATLQADIATLSDQVAAREADMATLTGQVSALVAERDSLAARVADLEAQLAAPQA